METIRTGCCIAGGGPAGVMLGYLLARAGVEVTVLEKHPDFFRDFRGDTVHPSTLEVMHELGLLEDLLELPHQRVTAVTGRVGDFEFHAADFRYVPTHCKFVALMPQWDFLNFLSERARRFAGFDLRMQHEGIDFVRDGERIIGVEARSPQGPLRIQSDLVVACDGRRSTLRKAAGLAVEEFGVPIDVLWFRISRHAGDPQQVLGNVNYGQALILINRGDYFQAGLIIRKGSFDEIQAQGLDAFRLSIARIAPYLSDRAAEIENWDQVKLLTVQINRLRKWWLPGMVCIGDAAHAMSPAGGVGINLAIQDAVAAANLLAAPLRGGYVANLVLERLQQRREYPTRFTQWVQVAAHKAFEAIFRNTGPIEAPWQLKAIDRMPGRKYVMGYVVGVGVRPEHVANPVNPRPERSLRTAAVQLGAAIGAIVRTARLLRSA
ncbi:MAG TPA: FAD-dependent oxidoreductase [Bryobacteraceae bacterium]|nr:FAD-dependent oxidoreductase [Bryobacteraceae bacterium]